MFGSDGASCVYKKRSRAPGQVQAPGRIPAHLSTGLWAQSPVVAVTCFGALNGDLVVGDGLSRATRHRHKVERFVLPKREYEPHRTIGMTSVKAVETREICAVSTEVANTREAKGVDFVPFAGAHESVATSAEAYDERQSLESSLGSVSFEICHDAKADDSTSSLSDDSDDYSVDGDDNLVQIEVLQLLISRTAAIVEEQRQETKFYSLMKKRLTKKRCVRPQVDELTGTCSPI